MDGTGRNKARSVAGMNTHDPAFRRAFRRGKKFFGKTGAFVVTWSDDADPIPIPFGAGSYFDQYWVAYFNPDGTRWRRFNSEQILKKMQEGKA